jgi:hypothetical protein
VEDEIADWDLSDMENTEAEGVLRAVLLKHADVFKGTGCCSDAPAFEIKLKKGVDPLIIDKPTRKPSPAEQRAEERRLSSWSMRVSWDHPWRRQPRRTCLWKKKTRDKYGKPEIRMVTDFWTLNSMTENDAYPPEDLHAIVEWLATKDVFLHGGC